MSLPYIGQELIDSIMNWPLAVSILRDGHSSNLPILKEMAIDSGPGHLLGKAVHLEGIGIGMKVAAIYPPNLQAMPPQPAEDALFIVFREEDWRIRSLVAGPPLTAWKTAADSALASALLSRPDSTHLLCIGAGPIAQALIEAHVSVRPSLTRVSIWNRTTEKAAALCNKLAEKHIDAQVAVNLDQAIAAADIVTAATSSAEPLVKGSCVRPGTHIDLVGAYSRTMRESDDALIRKSSVYVDCYDTTLEQTGDISLPIDSGVISASDIRGDLFELVKRPCRRDSDEEITLYKNGGGAHLDLMIAAYLAGIVEDRQL
jgi:ornithine cyclodeaminase/alanine dehydrogenase-like protein (mu-crystallin family)